MLPPQMPTQPAVVFNSPSARRWPTLNTYRNSYRGRLMVRLLVALLVAIASGLLISGFVNNVSLIFGGMGRPENYVGAVLSPALLFGLWFLARMTALRIATYATHFGQSNRSTTYRTTLTITIVLAALVAIVGIADTKDGARPTISGSALQSELRGNLAPAAGSPVVVSTIRCPVSKDYGDGDVARCTASTGTGSAAVFLVTVMRDGGEWRYTIDVE